MPNSKTTLLGTLPCYLRPRHSSTKTKAGQTKTQSSEPERLTNEPFQPTILPDTMSTFKLSSQDKADLTAFLRDLVRTPSPSSQEGTVAKRVMAEMTKLGLRDVHVDRAGSVVGWVGAGHGPLLMLNSHLDTVRVSSPDTWHHAPFGAEIDRRALYGLGACDAKSGLAAMVYGAKLLQEVELKGDVALVFVVQAESCEGVAAQVLIEQENIRPDWVVLSQPTDLNVSRGQRGRLEMRLVTYGCSAHAACPNLGNNAIYAAARLVFGLELLAGQLGEDRFLGPGTLAVTEISSSASSRNVIPDRCELIIDRRLTLGENETMALSEVQRIIAREGIEAKVEVTDCEITTYTGYTHHKRAFYPAWVMAEDHPLVVTAAQAVRAQTRRRPQIGRWDFSSDGVYTAGVAGIPTVGFGPGDPRRAHAANEHVRLDDVCTAAEVYARLAVELLGME
jgi:putative selenium metabolism hydrolase